MAHRVIDLGVMSEGSAQRRWLALAAHDDQELDALLARAALKGWTPIPLLAGTDPETGWPSVWVSKPLESNPGPNLG